MSSLDTCYSFTEGPLPLWHLLRVRSVNRTKDKESFDDESPQPAIGNLATHTRKDHAEKWEATDAGDDAETNPRAHTYTVASAKLMQNFLEEGKLNPRKDPTKKGFLLHFAAWILEDNLPFTTGESPGLQRLFQYLHIKFQLPTDTTVRNQLGHIYASLHGDVVKELSVSRILYLQIIQETLIDDIYRL